jgi:hypothetical protein
MGVVRTEGATSLAPYLFVVDLAFEIGLKK